MTTQPSTHIIDQVNKVVRTSRDMTREAGREPTSEELAERLAWPVDNVRKLLEIARAPIRLN